MDDTRYASASWSTSVRLQCVTSDYVVSDNILLSYSSTDMKQGASSRH